MNFNANDYNFDEDGFIRLQKDLNHAMRHIDSKNVDYIHTNITEVQSENGLTEIVGPLLNMYDTGGNLRLRAGYDTDGGEFLFSLYNQAGNVTIDLSDTGDARVYTLHTSQEIYVGRRIFIDWDSTQKVDNIYTTGFPYQGGLFLRTPSSDFPVSGERYMIGHILAGKTTGSTVFPYSHSLTIHSSGVLSLASFSWNQMLARAEIFSTLHTTGKSTDSAQIISFSGLAFINTYNLSSQTDSTTLRATIIGSSYREIYFGNTKNSSNRAACEGTQRHYTLEDDLIYYYQRNIRQYDEGHSTDWVVISTNVNIYFSQYYTAFANRRPVIRNNSTSAGYVYAVLTAAEGLTAFDALSFNDNTIATTNDYLVWSFYAFNTTGMRSTDTFIRIGDSSDDNYIYRCSSKAVSEGWNVFYFKFDGYGTGTEGTPNLNAAAYMRVGFYYRGTGTVLGTRLAHNFLGVIRKHPYNSTSPSVLQKYNSESMSWETVGYSRTDNEIVFYDTDFKYLALSNMLPYNEVSLTYPNQQHRDNFSAHTKFIALSTKRNSPIIGQFWDANNFWWAGISSAYLTFYSYYNSSNYSVISKALTDLPGVYGECDLWVTRSIEGFVDVNFKTSTGLYGTIEGYLPAAWYYKPENIVIGHQSTVIQDYTIRDFEVKSYDK